MTRLRPYRTDDQPAVVALWWDSWHSIRPGLRHPQPRARWSARWDREIAGRQDVVVAVDDGTIVGFAAADVAGRLLAQLFVAPARQGQGIGRRLLRWAQRAMPEGFVLHTLVDNVGSRAFYERHGLVAGDVAINPRNGMRIVDYRWTPAARPPRGRRRPV